MKGIYHKKLDELEEMIKNTDNFSKTFTFFMDHLGEDSEFTSDGKLKKNSKLKMALTEAAQKTLHNTQDNKVTNIQLIYEKNHKFYHGSCFINGLICMLIFFETCDFGIIAMHTGGNNMKYMRFTTIDIENSNAIVVNNPSLQRH